MKLAKLWPVGTGSPDRYIGLCTLIIGAVIYVTRPTISDAAKNGDPGANFLPIIVAILLMLLSILHIFRSESHSVQTEEIAESKARSGSVILTVAFILLTIGYVAMFEPLGFTPATLLYLWLSLTILGRKTLRVIMLNLAYSCVATLTFGIIVTRLFSAPLPGALIF